MRRAALLVLVLVTLSPCHLATWSSARADHVIADPNREYPVTPDVGPWMILAASYTGPDAQELSRQCVLQLRARDNLNAFVFNYADEERRKQQEELDRMQQAQPGARRRHIRIDEQCGVLIGGYPDMETARKALDGVKKLNPPKLNLGPNKTTTEFMTFITPDPKTNGATVQRMEVNPFTNAFVTRNPTTRHDSAAGRDKPDPFLKELNDGRPYSLLTCKKPYSLAVFELQGTAVIAPRTQASTFLSSLGLGSRGGDVLNASAKQAEEIARVLREMKIDAYVLHTRHSSIVAVGGYDDPNDKELLKMQNQMKRMQLGSIQFWDVPWPMKVPQL
jgi:hypothetical protein